MQCDAVILTLNTGPVWQLHVPLRNADREYIKVGIFHMFLDLLYHLTTIVLSAFQSQRFLSVPSIS